MSIEIVTVDAEHPLFMRGDSANAEPAPYVALRQAAAKPG